MEVKRELTLKECKHILRYCLSLPLLRKNTFDCEEDYNVYIKELKRDINLWIRCTYNYNIMQNPDRLPTDHNIRLCTRLPYTDTNKHMMPHLFR